MNDFAIQPVGPLSHNEPGAQLVMSYNTGLFTQGRMNFAWEELSDEERRQAYADWEAGRGFIGGDPRRRGG